jgi:hypothetical protein
MGDITWKETRFMRVPLTDEELRARGEQLATELHRLREMEADHAAQKKEMKEDEASQAEAVDRVARIVRDRAEERSVEIELRYHLGSNLLQEIRLDTGEVTATREATKDDQQRASLHAQTTIPGA